VTDAEIADLRAACPRILTHHRPRGPREVLADLAASTPAQFPFDRYGEAAWLGEFEARVAAELGKEAAAFMPSGTMAQQIALRIWCDRARNPTIAYHPLSHLEIHESRGYAMLHGLRALPVGASARLMTPADVRAISDPLGAFLVELPQREIGAQLPLWDDLVALCDAARATGAKVHLDGARLWEATPFYGRSHAQVAALFDSAYVSFYKGLGAIGGAMLAGDAAFVAEARTWQHRHGGRLFSLAPIALSARLGFERNLGMMGAWFARAKEIARALGEIPGVAIVPNPPQTNTFHVFLEGVAAELEDRAHAHAREHGTFSFARLAPTANPRVQKWEFVVGDATDGIDTSAIVRAVQAIVAGGED
jgi:threonine aldolase